ncbi:MAG: hypothetical protein H6925_01740 [Holosporaceae bacterium]|nr:MAG: hypothetical protein H6925_01740 [Holosporaceae bacterium]
MPLMLLCLTGGFAGFSLKAGGVLGIVLQKSLLSHVYLLGVPSLLVSTALLVVGFGLFFSVLGCRGLYGKGWVKLFYLF